MSYYSDSCKQDAKHESVIHPIYLVLNGCETWSLIQREGYIYIYIYTEDTSEVCAKEIMWTRRKRSNRMKEKTAQ
jgi:hypothetical protein